jgi:hypothetical protein
LLRCGMALGGDGLSVGLKASAARIVPETSMRPGKELECSGSDWKTRSEARNKHQAHHRLRRVRRMTRKEHFLFESSRQQRRTAYRTRRMGEHILNPTRPQGDPSAFLQRWHNNRPSFINQPLSPRLPSNVPLAAHARLSPCCKCSTPSYTIYSFVMTDA